jgi:hypothetical protein
MSLFKTFQQFNRSAPFNPPLTSSPATRGRTRGGGLNDLNDLNILNELN